MAVWSLRETISHIGEFFDASTNQISVSERHYYGPGFWAAISALAKHHSVPEASILIESEDHQGYATAIGLQRALYGHDDFQYERHNEGINYSSLVHLDSPESTDQATSTINGCIRNIFSDGGEYFIDNLCDVVGDLHDNVWSHGLRSGFSMAQKWKVPREEDNYLEFSLVDCGMGFLSEIRRSGREREINTDQEAITWCIQKGHSTKKELPEDDWAQSMPGDMLGNPLKGIENVKTKENHHLGIGLYKLTQLVREFRGELWLATGTSMLHIDEKGNMSYSEIESWSGVAISCRFRAKTVASVTPEKDSPEISNIMEALRR